jgi:hypothetical protein
VVADRSQSASDDLAEVDANAIAVGLGIGKEGMALAWATGARKEDDDWSHADLLDAVASTFKE